MHYTAAVYLNSTYFEALYPTTAYDYDEKDVHVRGAVVGGWCIWCRYYGSIRSGCTMQGVVRHGSSMAALFV